jgi:phosphoribosylanthranilate isomerase
MRFVFSRINNLTDARFAAAAGADWIGFNFNQSHPQYISPLKAKEIAGWLTGVKFFGEFNNHQIDEIKGICDIVGLEGIEVPAEQFEPEMCQAELQIFVNVELNEHNILSIQGRIKALSDQPVETIIRGEYGEKMNVTLATLFANPKVLFGLSSDPDKYIQCVKLLQPQTIVLEGNTEDKPGLSDLDFMRDVVEQLVD